MEKQLERPPTGLEWRDLTHMTRVDKLRELTLPLPWLALSLWLYTTPVWVLGFPAAYMFFLCGLRLNHEAIHNNLGLARNTDSLVMHCLSFLMGASNHAVAFGHMLHHKHSMGPGDFEGKCGHMRFWDVLCYGPRFPIDINREAWRGATPRLRRRIVVDWVLNLCMIGLAVGFGLTLHVVAMVIAQCLTALFAVWITHQGIAEAGVIARSQRGIGARLAYLMFYHREHHLFPNVPVHRLPVLAERLDETVPSYQEKRVPVVPWLERKTI